jgi:hypothetical protein
VFSQNCTSLLRTPLDWIGAKRGHSCQMQSNLDSKTQTRQATNLNSKQHGNGTVSIAQTCQRRKSDTVGPFHFCVVLISSLVPSPFVQTEVLQNLAFLPSASSTRARPIVWYLSRLKHAVCCIRMMQARHNRIRHFIFLPDWRGYL